MPSDQNDSKTASGAQISALRPAEILDNDAAQTWQAYNAMETTKSRHYGLLEILDNKLKNYNIKATDADQQLLQCLLDDHSAQVKRFTQASVALKEANPSAHAQLFDYIGVITNHQGMGDKTH